MIPREADRVKAVLRRRDPMPFTRKSQACGSDSDSVGSQGASVTDCGVFAADADYAPCHPPSDRASGRAAERKREGGGDGGEGRE